ERSAHLARMLLVDTEDHGLGEAVILLQVFGQMLGDRLGAGAQGDDALEVLGLIFVVRNCAAVAVEIVFPGPPAGRVPFRNDPVNTVWGEKPVLDPLPEAVFVDRRAEVLVGIASLIAQRSGGHAKLIGWREVVEDRAPRAIVARTAAVALIDD